MSVRDPVWRALGRRFVAIVLGVALGLVLAEGVVRLAGVSRVEVPRARPHPLFGWSHIPGSHLRIYGPDGQVSLRINSKGLREREIAYEKTPGVFRVLVLGDSMAEGGQLPEEHTFSRQLERELSEAGRPRRFEVINAGTGGYGTDNEVLFYEHEGVKYRPDLVLVAFCMANDVYDNSDRLLPVGTPGKPPKPYFVVRDSELAVQNSPCACQSPETASPIRGLLRRHSALYGLARRTLVRRWPSLASALADVRILGTQFRQTSYLDPDGIPLMFYNFSPNFSPAWEEAWQVTTKLLERLRDWVGANGGRLVVMGVPMREQVHPDLWAAAQEAHPSLKARAWDLDQPERLLAERLASLSIPYVSLLTEFRECAGQTGRRLFYDLADEGHLNCEGHALAARIARAALLVGGLGPARE